MALTTLDPRTALIAVDLQKGVLALPAVAQAAAGVVQRSADLADAFRARGLPVVLVNVDGFAPGRREHDAMKGPPPAGWTELAPGLRAQASDWRVTKRSPGAFTATGLEARLKDAGVTQVVVAGVSTGIGVETTGRQAYELGFNVTFAIDAMVDGDAAVHANSIERVFPRFGETGTCAQIAALLARFA
ncbi:isochorismatase family protein [Sphingomonas sp.]|uniref:isochorismatase family protein n=1 Tax=Sphingomonas sp. TaxID=28214 RepID=UPI0035BC5CA7